MARPSRGFSESIGIWKCWFLRRGENRSTRRKTSRSKDENQQQTQPTFDTESGNRTGPHWWVACVGDKCSTTAPSLLPCVTILITAAQESLYQNAYSSQCSPYISYDTNWENLFCDQEVLSMVVISSPAVMTNIGPHEFRQRPPKL